MEQKQVIISWKGPSISEIVEKEISEGRMPRYLYKYRIGLPNDNTRRIISDNVIFYSTPENFNDPFDCYIELDTTASLQEIETFITRNPHNAGIPIEQIKQQALDWFQKPDEFKRKINENAYSSLNKSGLSCFTVTANNILMWSHYADGHTGICLKFDVLADPEAFFPIFEVKYPLEYPKFNHIKNNVGETVSQLISHKAKIWAYEEEWRILKFGMPGYHNFKKEALVEISFGCKAKTDIINDTVKLLNASGMNHVKLRKAYLPKGSFNLGFESI